jgi:hypothetical protein
VIGAGPAPEAPRREPTSATRGESCDTRSIPKTTYPGPIDRCPISGCLDTRKQGFPGLSRVL